MEYYFHPRRFLVKAALFLTCLAIGAGWLCWYSPAQAIVPSPWPGRVLKILSGDTLVVARPDDMLVTIRVAEIDCPALNQPWGEQARRFTMSLTKGRHVFIVPGNLTQDGMVVARVELPGGDNLAEELIKGGLAWCWEHSRNNYLARLQKKASSARRGLWADSKPIPPWKWPAR